MFIKAFTSDLGGKWTSRDVFIVKFNNDVVVSWCSGEVGHSAGAIFVVLACDLSFGGTLHC